jgi:hypothetical protein
VLVAETHGKMSSGFPPSERMEDVLTSNVFSAFRYFGLVSPLVTWLQRARNVVGESLLLQPVALQVFFWPRATVGNRTREPDLLLIVRDDAGDELAIVVEAKYESGPSDVTEDESSTGDHTNGAEEIRLTGNQLADEYIAIRVGHWKLRDRAQDAVRRPPEGANRVAVLYVTSHYEMPIDVLTAAVEMVCSRLPGSDSTDVAHRFYWLSWRQLTTVLRVPATNGSDGQKRFLDDLHDLLVGRGLRPFAPVFADLNDIAEYVCRIGARVLWQELQELPSYARILNM